MSPLVKWACPEGKPTFGESHPPEHCITSCDDKCASPFLIAALTHSVRSNHHRGKYLSATALSGCKRKMYLERKLDYSEYMKNSFYSYRGTVMHQVVEDASSVRLGEFSLDELGYLTEWRMLIGFCFEHGGFALDSTVSPYDETTWEHVKCPQCSRSRVRLADREWVLLGGTLDGLEPLWKHFDPKTGVLLCILWDLKTMQEYAVNYFIKGDAKNSYHPHVKDAHFLQAQVYKYLSERSTPPDFLTKQGVKKIQMVESNIQAFSMGQFPRTGSSYMWKDHWRKPETLWEIPHIPFMEDEWTEEYIQVEAYPLYKSLILNEERPPVCAPEANKRGRHSWECDFCAFPDSKYCPNPAAEWAALQDGKSPDEAFTAATGTHT